MRTEAYSLFSLEDEPLLNPKEAFDIYVIAKVLKTAIWN